MCVLIPRPAAAGGERKRDEQASTTNLEDYLMSYLWSKGG